MQETTPDARQETVEENAQAERSLWITAIKSFFTDHNVILALITAHAFFFTFLYELGYCVFFGIPLEYISTSLILRFSLVISWVIALFSITILIIMPGLIGTMNIRHHTFVAILLSYNLVIFLLIKLFYNYVFNIHIEWRDLAYMYVVLLIGMSIISFSLRFLPYSKSPNGSKSTNWKQLGWNSHTTMLSFLFIVWCGFAFGLSWVGYWTAERIVAFQVIPESSSPVRKELVVLRIYGDYLIAAPLVKPTNKRDNLLERELYILNLSEVSQIPFTYKNVGPLKVKQEDS